MPRPIPQSLLPSRRTLTLESLDFLFMNGCISRDWGADARSREPLVEKSNSGGMRHELCLTHFVHLGKLGSPLVHSADVVLFFLYHFIANGSWLESIQGRKSRNSPPSGFKKEVACSYPCGSQRPPSGL
jgi:hypothetical protein